jgi:uncharacterized RmlC-like cupin family protein
VSLTADQLLAFATVLSAQPERWRDHVRPDSSERVYEQIWSSEEVNAWVICWSHDHDTGFHDHDQSGAGIFVVSGRVREDRLTVGGPPQRREFGPSARFHVPPVAIHRVMHTGDRPAVTIHAYSPPLRRTGAYTLASDGTLQREALTYETELRAVAAA